MFGPNQQCSNTKSDLQTVQDFIELVNKNLRGFQIHTKAIDLRPKYTLFIDLTLWKRILARKTFVEAYVCKNTLINY